MALRAGLAVSDVEFVQFHPTVLWTGPDAVGQQALVSEAVRGEGAVLYDGAGERVMAGVHPLADLAPRDVVAAAISRRMAQAPGGIDDHVFLDATHLGYALRRALPDDHRGLPSASASIRPTIASRSPPPPTTRAAACRPASTAPPRSTASTRSGRCRAPGVHGANRLASNSLTEGVVAGTRLGRDLAWELPDRAAAATDGSEPAAALLDRRPTAPRCGRRCRATSACSATPTRSRPRPPPSTPSIATAGDRRRSDARRRSRRPTSRRWRGRWSPPRRRAPRAAAATAAPTRPDPRDEWRLHLDVTLGADGGEPVLVRRDATLAVAGGRG